MEGTFTLHSETAKKNGGDYDFDWVCVVEGDRFPRFVASRFDCEERQFKQKQKLQKRRRPWWNLPQVAMAARGNQIGSITDLMTSCMAAGQEDSAYLLVDELQSALDQLKHGVEPNAKVISQVRKQVVSAPWLKLKKVRRVSEMPLHLDVPDTDRVGQMYNMVRKELHDLFCDTLPLKDFRGLTVGHDFSRDMYDQSRMVSRIYGANITWIMQKQEQLWLAAQRAEAEYLAKRNNPTERNEALFRRNQAQAAAHFYEERAREEIKALILFVQKWAARKNDNRLGWCEALHHITCKGKGSGSIVFHAFPQELVDQIVERTGGKAVMVEVPGLCDGEVEFDKEGRVFLVEQLPTRNDTYFGGRVLLVEVTDEGDILMDGRRISRVRPFSLQNGSGEVRDGKVIFAGTVQHPTVRSRTTVH